jgi:hypothetical protein
MATKSGDSLYVVTGVAELLDCGIPFSLGVRASDGRCMD